MALLCEGVLLMVRLYARSCVSTDALSIASSFPLHLLALFLWRCLLLFYLYIYNACYILCCWSPFFYISISLSLAALIFFFFNIYTAPAVFSLIPSFLSIYLGALLSGTPIFFFFFSFFSFFLFCPFYFIYFLPLFFLFDDQHRPDQYCWSAVFSSMELGAITAILYRLRIYRHHCVTS